MTIPTVDELRHALRTAGFIDPDDGTVPMWPNGDDGGAVWVSGRRLCEVIIAIWGVDDLDGCVSRHTAGRHLDRSC